MSPPRQMDESPGGQAEAFRLTINVEGTGIVSPQASDAKRIATVRAKAALIGCTLHMLDGSAFLLSRWGMSREFSTLAEVEALLRRMGGRRHG